MAMTPRSNSLSTRARGNLRLLVHLPDERPDLAFGELADAVAEQHFVLGQHGQRLGVFQRLFGHEVNVIIGLCGNMHVALARRLRLVAGLRALRRPAQRSSQPPPTSSRRRPPPPATQPQRQRPPVIRSGINFVSVDVIVTDKKTGEVVLDMKQDDFEVREDRKPQKVDTFEIVKIDALASNAITPKAIRSTYDEESEARQPNVRLFILLLDDYHVRRGNDMAVRKPLIDFVQTQLAPQDMVAVMYPLTPVSALTFTRNRDSLIQSINNFEGRKGLYEPRNEFEERYAYYPVQTVENIRNDVTMGALKGAAVRLGGMRDGRKSIIFVSEGLTSTRADAVRTIPSRRCPASAIRTAAAPASIDRTTRAPSRRSSSTRRT